MSVALVTGSGGLVGSESVEYLLEKGLDVVGIDNDMRSYFFGEEASTKWRVAELEKRHKRYRHQSIDIRDFEALEKLFSEIGQDLVVVIHAAAQPSHDWAVKEPFTDFGVNAVGTLNMLEATRRHAAQAAFIFMSTNKVYGDTPNFLPLVERETRWEIDESHQYFARGIDESMSIDQCTHSLFGASKVSADVLVQEYGRYFQMNTACFRGGCLTGGGHSGSQLHGFLAYLMKCTVTGAPYTVFGYKGKQVRDNLHAHDLVNALWQFASDPKPARVYNIGGGRFANCSMMEAIEICQRISANRLNYVSSDHNRVGDHIWWISDISAFQADYPNYRLQYDIEATLQDIHDAGKPRWIRGG
ncbi:NAD-dependent epimerase/dehydratase family protein [Mesorhizobium sp. AR10]|uniref:NAD-dependent epimerase/dehydratase family protein n=1 Tax=Mesorhizobium sp. AR10 TaxID=2865839 RepID=UPI0021608CBD|nr:NAD-dependent epimerase/dehydratase family protein [Mesorhizobium sp. AR10]UVK39777.1 NAD-dependent epimerase/dehydratase family protein [Mesorhizobium sp. AR10]